MINSETTVRLHTLKAKIESLLNVPDSQKRIYRIIPYVEEMSEILDTALTPNAETLIKSASYYRYLGACYEKLPFYPHAVRCYTRAFTKLMRAAEEFGDGEALDKLSELYYRIVFLRNCIARDLARADADLCPEHSKLMNRVIGEEKCRDIVNGALSAAKASPVICPAGHSPQFYNCLYEVEAQADRKISQLDPALVSESSLDSVRIKLFAEKGIEWCPPRIDQ